MVNQLEGGPAGRPPRQNWFPHLEKRLLETRSGLAGDASARAALHSPRFHYVALNRWARRIVGISSAKIATAAQMSRTAKAAAASRTTNVMMA